MKAILKLYSKSRFFALLGGFFLFVFPLGTRFIYGASSFFPQGEWSIFSWYVSELVLWAAILFFVASYLKAWRARGFARQSNWTIERLSLLLFLLFFVYSLVGSFFVSDPLIAQQAILRLLAGVIFLIMFASLTRNELRYWLVMFLLGSFLPFGLAFAQVFFQYFFASTLLGISLHDPAVLGVSVVETAGGRWLRGYGSFAHPNIFGGYAVLVMIVAWLVGTRMQELYTRLVAYGALVCASIGVVISFSRAAWLIVLFFWAGVAVHVCVRRRTQLMQGLLVVTVTILVFVGILFPVVQSRLQSADRLNVISQQERVSGVGGSFELIKSNFLFGVGPGHYTQALYAMHPREPWWFFVPVHNALLLLVGEYGLVGVLLLCAGFLLWFWKSLNKVASYKTVCVFLFIVFVMFIQFDHFWLSLHCGIFLSVVWISVPHFFSLLSKKIS